MSPTAYAVKDKAASRAVIWDPSFFRRNALFWPVARAAGRLEGFARWPEPEELACLFEGEAPVRFQLAAPRMRRGRRLGASDRYDAFITERRIVPTRRGSWHDLLNALVWATFPRAKLALHARQHRAVTSRLGPDLRLPGGRTRDQDAVAMLDEGGVVLLQRGGETPSPIVFGHAIYERLVCDGRLTLWAAAVRVPVDDVPEAPQARAQLADGALEALFSSNGEIARGDLGSCHLVAGCNPSLADA
jgi:hypothetical protein